MNEPLTFIVDPSEADRDHIGAQLGPEHEWVGHDSVAQFAQAVDERGIPAVVILGPGVDHDQAMMLAMSVHDEGLAVGVVRVTERLQPDHLRDALRAGVADVVEHHADPVELTGAVKRARDELATSARTAMDASAASRERNVPVVAVAAGKGGVGASLVATNLAVALADRKLRVTLVDLDVRGGDLAIMMQQRPSLSVLDALDRVDHLDANAIDGYLTNTVNGVRILAAPVDGQDVYVDPEALQDLLGLVGNVSDVVIVDVGDTFRPVAHHVLAEAARVVLVTTLEVPSIRGTRRLLGEFAHQGISTNHVLLVANQADAATGLPASDAEKTLDMSFVTGIAEDKYGPRSVNEGDPVVNRRRSKAAKGIKELAGVLYKQLALEP